MIDLYESNPHNTTREIANILKVSKNRVWNTSTQVNFMKIVDPSDRPEKIRHNVGDSRPFRSQPSHSSGEITAPVNRKGVRFFHLFCSLQNSLDEKKFNCVEECKMYILLDFLQKKIANFGEKE